MQHDRLRQPSSTGRLSTHLSTRLSTRLSPRPFHLLYLLLAALGACTTLGPEHISPTVDAPAQWADRHGGAPSLAAPAEASAAWPADRWSVFGDPRLLELQGLARASNADARTAALRLMQARVEQTTVSAQRGLQTGARSAVSRQRQSESGAGSRVAGALGSPANDHVIGVLAAPFSVYQAGFDASWEPDLWGRVLRSEQAAQASTQGQDANLRQVQLGVSAEVARHYFALRQAQAQRRLVEQELAAARATQALLQSRHEQGLTDDSALLGQRAGVTRLQATLPALEQQEAQAINRLSLLCGTDPGALNGRLMAERAELAEPLAGPLPDLRLGLPSDLARRRPDVAAAEARLRAATAGIGIAQADLYPRITLGASFGFETVDSASIAAWGTRQWSVGPSLSLPLFDGGRRRATVALRELQQQEAAVAFRQTVLLAWHEVDDAVAAYIAEAQRLQQNQQRLGLGEDQSARSQARYDNGLGNYLPVLAAQTTLLQTRRDIADGQARQRIALAALFKTLGEDAGAGTAAGPRSLTADKSDPGASSAR
jgi:NodT family efflux transporter outer membrane factor (OMF) lipoprotein